VWWIVLDEFIMLCIDYHYSLEHHVADGKCKEYVDKTKRLITKEVNCMLNATTTKCGCNSLVVIH
jgi:hypothetical protein